MNCTGCYRETDKTLHTGQQVCGYCPEWILECEAVHLLKLPLAERRKLLGAFEDKRGGEAITELKKRLVGLHNAKQRHV